MARERDYRPVLRWVAVPVLTVAPVVLLRVVVGPGAPPKGASPYILLVHGESTHYEDASIIF